MLMGVIADIDKVDERQTGVIGMFHDSHELDGIVAEIFYSGKDILGELGVGSYPRL